MSAEPVDGRSTHLGRRAQFDRFVAREYAGLLAEATVLVDDREEAARLLRRVLAATRRDRGRVTEPDDLGDLVRDHLVRALPARAAHPAGDGDDGPRPAALVALGTLPEVQRRALVLRHVLGRSIDQVAADTGASVDTVRRRLWHGAWALANHHPENPTIPGANLRGGRGGPLDRWVGAELRALRREMVGVRETAVTDAESGRPRRLLAAAAVSLGVAIALAIVGPSWSDAVWSPPPTAQATFPAP